MFASPIFDVAGPGALILFGGVFFAGFLTGTIVVETLVVWLLRWGSFYRSLLAAFLMNLASTLLGFVLFGLSLLGLDSLSLVFFGFILSGQYIRLGGTSMAAPMVAGAVALLLQDEPNLTPDQVKFRLTHSGTTITGDGVQYPYLNIFASVYNTSTDNSNFGQTACQLLWTGSNPTTWGSVAWNSVAWNSVAWNSVAWNPVAWNSVAWNSAVELDGIFWGHGKSEK